MKPANWRHLPKSVLEKFLWDCNIAYSPYESSKAETIHGIINDCYLSLYNDKIINEYWQSMSEDVFLLRLKRARESLTDEIRKIDEMLDNKR